MILRYFAGHPTAANVLMIVLLALGLLSLGSLRRETFPDFSESEIEVAALYPGASAEEVATAVCRRLEEALEGLDGLEELRSEAREGYGRVVATMREGGDFQAFAADARAEIDALEANASWPERADRPIVRRLGQTDAVVSVAVTGPEDPTTLQRLAERLAAGLRRLPEVAKVEERGFSDSRLLVEVNRELLARHDLSLRALAETLRGQAVDAPLGLVESHERDLLIRLEEERRTPAELGEVVVLADPRGTVLRLRDIATITRSYEDPEVEVRFDGRRAAILDVAKAKAQDSLRTLEAVKRHVEEERGRLPAGVRLDLTRDFTSLVRDRLEMLVRNGWQGLLLVFLTMWLFFSFRLAFWVTMGLPVAFLVALFAMAQLDYSINMITMVALLLALGLLMDDAIVIAENVARHLREGAKGLEAAVRGISEVGAGVFSSFLTTVVVFAPLSYLDGRIGQVLRVLPVVLIVVLAASLIEAFLILPNHLSHLKPDAEPRGFRRRFDGLVAGLRGLSGHAAKLAVRWRWVTLAASFGLLVLAVGTLRSGRLKFQALPSIDGDVIVAQVLLPQGTPLDRTRQVVGMMERTLHETAATFPQPGGAELVRHVTVEFGQNRDAMEVGPHVATLSVDLLGAEEREATIDAFCTAWRERLGTPPDVVQLRFGEPAFGPTGRPVEIELSGVDPAQLDQAAHALEKELRGFIGVDDVKDDQRPGKPELRLELKPAALGLGVRAATLAEEVRHAFQGGEVMEIQDGPFLREITVRLPRAERARPGDLEGLWIELPGGGRAALADLVTIRSGRGVARVVRIDGVRTATVTAELDTTRANTEEVLREVRDGFVPKLQARYPGLRVHFSGEMEESGKTQGSMKRALLIGLIGIFALLAFHFRGYGDVLVVMLAIPLALVGVVGGHLLLGYPLTMPSLLGFVSLAGVVVNDSILLVTFVRVGLREGLSAAEAAVQASTQRFRAILLTSLTTVAGLLPLLFERSLQAQVLIPLAISIVFGLLASTLLVLLVIPAFYAALTDLGVVRPKQASRGG